MALHLLRLRRPVLPRPCYRPLPPARRQEPSPATTEGTLRLRRSGSLRPRTLLPAVGDHQRRAGLLGTPAERRFPGLLHLAGSDLPPPHPRPRAVPGRTLCRRQRRAPGHLHRPQHQRVDDALPAPVRPGQGSSGSRQPDGCHRTGPGSSLAVERLGVRPRGHDLARGCRSRGSGRRFLRPEPARRRFRSRGDHSPTGPSRGRHRALSDPQQQLPDQFGAAPSAGGCLLLHLHRAQRGTLGGDGHGHRRRQQKAAGGRPWRRTTGTSRP